MKGFLYLIGDGEHSTVPRLGQLVMCSVPRLGQLVIYMLIKYMVVFLYHNLEPIIILPRHLEIFMALMQDSIVYPRHKFTIRLEGYTLPAVLTSKSIHDDTRRILAEKERISHELLHFHLTFLGRSPLATRITLNTIFSIHLILF